MTGSASLLNIPPISFFAFQIEKSEPRGNVTKNRRFIKNSFDVLLLFRFKVGHQMTPNGKPSPKLKIPCANNTCGFDPHHRHPKQPGIERFRAAFPFFRKRCTATAWAPCTATRATGAGSTFSTASVPTPQAPRSGSGWGSSGAEHFLSKSIDNCQCA